MIPMLCFVTVLVIDYMGFRRRTKEYRELEHFAEFLSDLKNQFYLCKSVTESIFRAAEPVPGSLRKRLEKICFLLEEDAGGSALTEDVFPEHLKCLRLFWIQCRSAVQYGSGKNSTESVFVKNMTELRRDVQNECYRRAQAKHLFAGMGVVTVMPLFFLPFIRWFGVATLKELEKFYDGAAGRAVVSLFLILTAGCYLLIELLRKSDKKGYRRPEILQKCFSYKIFSGVSHFVKGSKAADFGRKQLEEAGIEADGGQYWIVCGATGVLGMILAFLLIKTSTFFSGAVVGLCGMGIGTAVMMGFYKYMGYLRKLGMNGEVLGLQAVILLLIDVPNITLTELLDVLSGCGALFQKQLYRCADAYAAEDVKALEQLFEKETFPAFRQMAGRLLAAERVGLKGAFEEIGTDRHFFREQLRLDSEEEQKKKAANAQVIAFLPMMFLLFAYLILPFLGASLDQMGDIFKEMEQIRYF